MHPTQKAQALTKCSTGVRFEDNSSSSRMDEKRKSQNLIWQLTISFACKFAINCKSSLNAIGRCRLEVEQNQLEVNSSFEHLFEHPFKVKSTLSIHFKIDWRHQRSQSSHAKARSTQHRFEKVSAKRKPEISLKKDLHEEENGVKRRQM